MLTLHTDSVWNRENFMPEAELLLVYDTECMACDNYCQMVRIRESVGQLKLISARENSPVLKELTEAGLDIDQGMVLKMGNELYYGADAMHMLSLIGTRVGIFNRLNYWLFRSKQRSQVLYPVLRFFRNLLLKVRGRTKINNLGKHNNERF
jgi:predicted DCC family thiol-disulfide oxidoreductase YuxK